MLTEEERAARDVKAREMFAQGVSVNKVAEDCFNNNWAGARALKDQIDGVAPKAGKKAGKKKAKKRPVAEGGGSVEPETETETGAEAEIEDWDLTLRLPGPELQNVFSLFTDGEKASAIQHVMQARLDALMEE